MIKIEHLKKEYENATPLKDVSVEINKGDIISIIGPSGTGKSTLLRCINMLEKPSAGRIFIDDEEITDSNCDINKLRQKMGMVFQSFNLFNHLTVIENIMLSPMKLKNVSKQEAFDKAIELLRMVGLAEKIFNYPDELSGGQKQRVAIARALAMDPEIIMFDEPTSALDPTMVGEVEAVIRQLAETGKTMLIVTHEMNFARSISNRVFYMDEGGIYEDGTPAEIFDHPRKENTRRFVHKLKVLTLDINSRNYDFLGMATQIETYCNRNQISHIVTKRILLIFEEISQKLIKTLDKPRIKAILEYSQENNNAYWTFDYGNSPLDILKDDGLESTVVKGMCEQIKHSLTDDSDLVNQLYLKVRFD